MSDRRVTWTDSFRALSQSALGVLRAEVALLSVDYKRWGKRLAIALGLLAMAGMLGFWLAALVVYASVRFTQSFFELGPWQAALAVGGVALVLILALIGTGALLLRGIDDPIRATKQRFADNQRWWQSRVVGDADPDES